MTGATDGGGAPGGTEFDRGVFLYERWKYEDETLGQRTDWFLVFHGILVEAFFAAETSPHRIPVALFGALTSFLWLWIGIRQRWDHQHLVKILETEKLSGSFVSASIGGIFKVRRTEQPWWLRYARATPSFTIVIPAATTLLWTCCLAIVAEGVPAMLASVTPARIAWTAGLLFAVVLSAILGMWLVGNGPDFSDPKFTKPLEPHDAQETK